MRFAESNGMAGLKVKLGMTMTLLAALAASGCDEGIETIGPEGGTVTSHDGRVTLEIPPGALDREITVTIGEVDDGPEGAIGFAYEIEPRLTMLHRPALLTYDLMPAGPEGTESLDLLEAEMDDVSLVTEKGTHWDRMADRNVDPELGTVSASVMFFSAYAVVID